uniref:Uncharacterized protein n=2 Tax=Onchocerca TaxID=6281 RepID=A0A8R1TXH0_ONCVO
MFANLFSGNFTVPQMAMFTIAVILIFLSLVIALNCYIECCSRHTNDLQKCGDNQQFFGKGDYLEYYDEICILFYRHSQMEIKQIEKDWELKQQKEALKKPTRYTKLLQERSRTNCGKLLLLKDNLEPLKINHNVEIKDEVIVMEKMVNKRKTWTGIDDGSKFEPVQMPTVGVTQGIQTT